MNRLLSYRKNKELFQWKVISLPNNQCWQFFDKKSEISNYKVFDINFLIILLCKDCLQGLKYYSGE